MSPILFSLAHRYFRGFLSLWRRAIRQLYDLRSHGHITAFPGCPRHFTHRYFFGSLAQPPAMSEEHSAVAQAQRTVLAVDDQQGVLIAIAFYLESFGFRVLCAESGSRAIELIRTESIDAVLLDVQMPQLNGFNTCRKLQTAVPIPPKVWFMTAAVSREIREASAQAGGLGVFQKPFDWGKLVDEISRSLATPSSMP